MGKIPYLPSSITVRKYAPVTLSFFGGYAFYHKQTREETFFQQVPHDVVRVYSTVAPWFRFLRRQSDLAPETLELMRCTRITNFASNWGVSSDALRTSLLHMEVSAGRFTDDDEECASAAAARLGAIIKDMEKWRPNSLLLACKAALMLPPCAEARTLVYSLRNISKNLDKEAKKASVWTSRIYGKNAPVPLTYEEKPVVNNLISSMARKQNTSPAIPFDWLLRWEVIVPLSLALLVLLGQDGLGIGTYRTFDFFQLGVRKGRDLMDLSERGWIGVKGRFDDMPAVKTIASKMSLSRFPAVSRGLSAMGEAFRVPVREVDRFIDRIRSRFSPQPPLPPKLDPALLETIVEFPA